MAKPPGPLPVPDLEAVKVAGGQDGYVLQRIEVAQELVVGGGEVGVGARHFCWKAITDIVAGIGALLSSGRR